MNLKLSMALHVWGLWEMQPLRLNFSFFTTGGRLSLSQYSKKNQSSSFRFTQGQTDWGNNPAHDENL